MWLPSVKGERLMRHEMKELAEALSSMSRTTCLGPDRTALRERARRGPALRSVSACRGGQLCALADIKYSIYGGILKWRIHDQIYEPPTPSTVQAR